MLRLKGDFQGEISVRKVAEDVKKRIYSIEKEIENIGTDTAVRISKVHLKRLKADAEELKKSSTLFGELSEERLKVMLDKQSRQLQIDVLDYYDKVLRQEEKMARDAHKYNDLVAQLAVLMEMDFSEIQKLAFDHKTNRIAEDTANLTTINYFADLARIHELKNEALDAKSLRFVEAVFVQNFKEGDDFDQAFEPFLDFMESEMTAFAQERADNAFEPSVELEEIKKDKIPTWMNGYYRGTRSNKRIELFKQRARDLLEARQG